MRNLPVSSALGVALAGCASLPDYSGQELAAIAPISAALKCAFAKALQEEANPSGKRISRLKGRRVTGTFTFKLVVSHEGSASARGNSKILTYGSASFGPYLGFTQSANQTVTTKINFIIDLERADSSACDAYPESSRAKYGFQNWFKQVVTGLDLGANLQPVGRLSSLEYQADFGVKNVTNAGMDFDVVFVSGNLGYAATRDDVQSIAFKIAARGSGAGGGAGPGPGPLNSAPRQGWNGTPRSSEWSQLVPDDKNVDSDRRRPPAPPPPPPKPPPDLGPFNETKKTMAVPDEENPPR